MTDPAPTPAKRPVAPMFIVLGALIVIGLILVVMDELKSWTHSAPPATPAPVAAAKPPIDPASIKGASQSVRAVEREGDKLVVTVIEESSSDPDIIEGLKLAVLGVGFSIQAGAPEAKDAQTVLIKCLTPAIDRLGNPKDGGVVNLTFPADDLRRANLENLGPDGTLNLATSVVTTSAIGERALVGWCRGQVKKREGDLSPFCRLALS